MSEMNNKELRKSTPVTIQADENQMALDDGRRVKVLSPGMMVFKRFIRNKLAIAGICILVFMFAFSFLGGLISPYGEAQVFHKTDSANKELADSEINKTFRFWRMKFPSTNTAKGSRTLRGTNAPPTNWNSTSAPCVTFAGRSIVTAASIPTSRRTAERLPFRSRE